MNAKTVTFAPQELIEEHDDIARELFRDLLRLDYDDCYVSDESSLADFSSCGLPDEFPEPDTLEQLYALWDEWVIKQLQDRYHVTVTKTSILMRSLFLLIEEARGRALKPKH